MKKRLIKIEPIYDDTFFEGLNWLASQDEDDMNEKCYGCHNCRNWDKKDTLYGECTLVKTESSAKWIAENTPMSYIPSITNQRLFTHQNHFCNSWDAKDEL